MSEDGDTGVTTGGAHPIGSAQTLPARPHATVERKRIGRYRIIKRLGAGGMGEVWEATDPDLGRNVAIKLLHDGVMRPHLAERLRREAQALAKLDHPNVVTVYDVGLDDSELYIVMQLVTGATLDRAIEKRTQRERIALLVQAGRGLAAAHAAGIVHRDFKPTNVLVDERGHVRVSDFGLARASHASDEAPEMLDGDLAMSMTKGELVGTPAYMAPEQLRGGPVTHATDQFAFCITLWEVLAGQRPFTGPDVAALRDAVLANKKRELPAGIPRRIRALLLRGLATEPKARFRSMAELLEELAPNRRGLWVAAGIGVAALATTTVLLGVTRPEAGDPCRGVDQPIDSVWNDNQRAAVRSSLGSLATPAIAALDDRTARWRLMRSEACQASHVSKDPQSLDERDARYACLDRSLIDERAAVAVLAGPADGRLKLHALDVAAGGTDPGDCTRSRAAERLRRAAKPLDPALVIELAAANALRESGRTESFLALRSKLEPRVLATGDQEAIAEWYYGVAHAMSERGDSAEPREPMRRSAEAALAARRDDMAAHAWAELAVMTARGGDLEGADNLLVMARGAAARSDRPLVGVWVELSAGQVAVERADYKGAIASCTHALEVARELGEESRFLLEALGCVYDAQVADGDVVGAVATSKRRLERSAARFGAESPAMFESERGMAIALAASGDTAGASAHWDTALAGFERTFGAESPEMVWTLRDFALSETPGGATSTPKALAAIQRAATIAEKTFATAPLQRIRVYEAMAFVNGALKNLDASIAAYEKVIQLYETQDDPAALARTLYNAADGLRQQERCDRALPMYERGARVAASTGQRTAIEAGALYGRGACLGAEKKWDEADAALRLSIDQFDKLGQILFAAQSRWELADQLVKRGRRAEGIEIAKTAAAQLEGKPPPADAFRAEILAWIKKP